MNSFLLVPQKKGNPEIPDGRLTVYAKMISNKDNSYNENEKTSPLQQLIKKGFLVAQGNYRDQKSLRDFLAQEFGTSIEDEDGLKHFVEGLGGIEGALDPDKFKEKLQELEDLEDFIPTPAKMSPFSSEDEILKEEGDIFYIGEFENSANANLAVNAITILYQATYREKQISVVRDDIDNLISSLDIYSEDIPKIENNDEEKCNNSFLLTRIVPDLIHAHGDEQLKKYTEKQLWGYLVDYPHKSDIEQLISYTQKIPFGNREQNLVELIVLKIESLRVEDFTNVAKYAREISKILEDGDI